MQRRQSLLRLLLVGALMFSAAGLAIAPRVWADPPPRPRTPATQPYASAENTAPDPLFAPPATPFSPSASPEAAARELDAIILAEARRQNIAPAPLIGDEAFLRRASIDLLGRVPTARERREFLELPEADRRDTLIRRLMTSERYVQRWTTFFEDILRIHSRGDLGDRLRQYVTNSLREGKPYDKMVRELLVARGGLNDPAAGFLIAHGFQPLALPGVIAQQFLGVRMSCAQCHDHPFDTWTQEQYFALAAYFDRTQVYADNSKQARSFFISVADHSVIRWPEKLHNGAPGRSIKANWPFRRVEEKAGLATAAAQTRPAEKKAVTAEEIEALAAVPGERGVRGLDAGMSAELKARAMTEARLVGETTDAARKSLADAIISPTNRYFAWNIVNRVWAEMLGSGIVQPVDDFRSGNPPRNPALLNRLADEFVAHGHDLRFLIETIARTQAYQRARLTGDAESRRAAERAFVAAPLRRMPAEALYDSLVIVGHLDQYKHRPGANVEEVTFTVEERRLRSDKAMAGEAPAGEMQGEMMMSQAGAAAPGAATPAAKPAEAKKPAAAPPPARVISLYSAEEIDSQIVSAIKNPLAESTMGMADMKGQAAQMATDAERMQSEENVEYVRRTVTEMRDNNPRFTLSPGLDTPADSEHLIRQLGQTSRSTLGEKRDNAANIRQSLILLNGKLVNEAARVGELEPMEMMMDERKPVDAAIELAYVEALSRQPTDRERKAALALVGAAAKRREGIADLRWVLLNSHEFRYLP